MFVLLLKYHALQLFVDLLSNHQLTKLNILVEFCCSLCAFPVPLAQPLLLFHYPSHGHIRARAKQRHWLESQNVLTADLSFWWFRSCTITCYLDVLCFWGKHVVTLAPAWIAPCYDMIPDETAICQRLFSEETYGRFSKWKGLPVLGFNA